jgi:hypothetical protein
MTMDENDEGRYAPAVEVLQWVVQRHAGDPAWDGVVKKLYQMHQDGELVDVRALGMSRIR